MHTRRARLLLGALSATLAVLAGATAASASSIVYVNDHNVWLMNPDGSGKYQVTLDGTTNNPYLSPSQAGDGTIVAVHAADQTGSSNDKLVRMRQNGSVIGAFTPEVTFTNGLEQADVSPDGTKIAYMTSFNGNGDCSSPGSTTFCYVMHVTAASGPSDLGGASFTENPDWISNSRLVANESHQRIVTYDVGASDGVEWFGRDIGPDFNGSLYDPSNAGNHVAAYEQNPFPSKLDVFRMNGAPPAVPSAVCSYSNPSGGNFNDPAFSPDGGALAYEASDRDPFTPLTGNDGIYVSPSITDSSCADASLVAAGGEEPDWGPADVNPGPRGGGNGGDDTTPPDVGAAVVKTKLGKALKQGFFTVKVQTSEAGAVVISATVKKKVVARGSRALPRARIYAVKVKFTKKAKRKFRHAKKLKMKVHIVAADKARNAVAGNLNATLKR
jgi:dipeptidyl aminopeptidase/acylaminoacyl peptidase